MKTDTKSGKNRGRGNKREQILQGALKVFAQKGYYQSKISEIAQSAGVADGTIYLYFDKKDDILISLFEERMEQVNDSFKRATDGMDNILEQISVYIRRHLQLAEEDPDLAHLFTIELRQSTRFMKEYKNVKFMEYLGHLETLIGKGQQQGVIRRDTHARWIARMMFGALDEILLAFCLSKKGNNGELVEQIASILIQGICDRSNT